MYFGTDGQLVDAIHGPEASGPARGSHAVHVDADVTQARAQAELDPAGRWPSRVAAGWLRAGR